MRAAHDLLRDILRTAHVTGLSREHQEAIGEALAAQVYEASGHGRVGPMPLTIAPLDQVKASLAEIAANLDALADRPPEAREMAERLRENAVMLRAIGGPIDPNAPGS
jgi:hypothetical protein